MNIALIRITGFLVAKHSWQSALILYNYGRFLQEKSFDNWSGWRHKIKITHILMRLRFLPIPKKTVTSVTRFGDISPLWHDVKTLWQFWMCSISICQNFELILANLLCDYAYFHWCKEKNIKYAAIAQWIRLHLPSCHPRFESQVHHLHFFHLEFLCYICHVKSVEIIHLFRVLVFT